MFKVHLPHAQTILQSHSPSQVALTNLTFPIGGGGTSAGRSAKFDSISEIGYRSPWVFRVTSEDQKTWPNEKIIIVIAFVAILFEYSSEF